MWSLFLFTIYSIVGLTSYITRVVGRMGEENRIHISETTKDVLDKLGGFRCEYRAVLDLGVCLDIFRHKSLILKAKISFFVQSTYSSNNSYLYVGQTM